MPKAIIPPIAPLAISLCSLSSPTIDNIPKTIIARKICGRNLPNMFPYCTLSGTSALLVNVDCATFTSARILKSA